MSRLILTRQRLKNSSTKLLVLRLLVLALLCNAVAPVLAGQDRVLLCTSKGYQWVILDQQTAPTNELQERCVLCLANDDDGTDLIDKQVIELTFFSKNENSPLFYFAPSFSHSPEFFSLSRAPPMLNNKYI